MRPVLAANRFASAGGLGQEAAGLRKSLTFAKRNSALRVSVSAGGKVVTGVRVTQGGSSVTTPPLQGASRPPSRTGSRAGSRRTTGAGMVGTPDHAPEHASDAEGHMDGSNPCTPQRVSSEAGGAAAPDAMALVAANLPSTPPNQIMPGLGPTPSVTSRSPIISGAGAAPAPAAQQASVRTSKPMSKPLSKLRAFFRITGMGSSKRKDSSQEQVRSQPSATAAGAAHGSAGGAAGHHAAGESADAELGPLQRNMQKFKALKEQRAGSGAGGQQHTGAGQQQEHNEPAFPMAGSAGGHGTAAAAGAPQAGSVSAPNSNGGAAAAAAVGGLRAASQVNMSSMGPEQHGKLRHDSWLAAGGSVPAVTLMSAATMTRASQGLRGSRYGLPRSSTVAMGPLRTGGLEPPAAPPVPEPKEESPAVPAAPRPLHQLHSEPLPAAPSSAGGSSALNSFPSADLARGPGGSAGGHSNPSGSGGGSATGASRRVSWGSDAGQGQMLAQGHAMPTLGGRINPMHSAPHGLPHGLPRPGESLPPYKLLAACLGCTIGREAVLFMLPIHQSCSIS